jgi:hypothetical protein
MDAKMGVPAGTAPRAVAGLDSFDDEDGEVLIRPLVLVGRRADGVEEAVGTLTPDLIRQSAFLMGIRWSDKTSERVVVDVYPQILKLLVRFGRLVLEHNQLAAAQQSTASSEIKLLPLPIKTLPVHLGPHNRAMHLPHMIGYSVVLADFLNILAERPFCVYQCAQAAERLLWEPAQIAMLLKFATILHGLSLPFMELIWPLEKNIAEEIRALDTVLDLTNKFFTPTPITDKKLLPQTPANNKRNNRRRLLKPASSNSTTKAPPYITFSNSEISNNDEKNRKNDMKDAISTLDMWLTDAIEFA